MKVFEELLLDADWSVNAGSWMWLSCSAFFQQFFHCYCPVGFGRRTDPTGDYIRRYIPILKDYPNRYIYEPWNAPDSVQKAANCVVGVDYPKPMINHAEGSRLNIERMKQVYQQLSHYRGLSLLASVPTIQEEAEPPMTDESQTSSGPDSPPKPPDTDVARCSTAPDSSTLGPTTVPNIVSCTLAPDEAQCTSSGHTHEPPPTISSTCSELTTAHTSHTAPCSVVAPTLGRTTSLGPRRKSMARKARRSQRQRGRQNCALAAKEGDMRTDGESRDSTAMEEDVEQEDERMEAELSGE